jgi:aminocarboxymuconate-semialdehyde decarboxylase
MRGRLDLAFHAPRHEYNPVCHAHITRPPSAYFDRLYLDTAVGGRARLAFLIDAVGAERVLFGSDDPFEISDADGAMALPYIRAPEPRSAAAIAGGTLARLLGAVVSRRSRAQNSNRAATKTGTSSA